MRKFKPYWKSRNKIQKILSVIALIITIVSMFWLYDLGFNVSVKDDTVLSENIDEYFFTESVDAKIISKEKIGNRLFVFFTRNGYDGHYGVACLERGIFGKYRFVNAYLRDDQLYSYEYANQNDWSREYILVTGVNELPNVDSYAIFPFDNYENPIYTGKVEQVPFMKVIKTNGEELGFPSECFVYYDADGNVVDTRELRQALPKPAEGGTPGVGSAELELVYVYLGIIFVLGMVFVRYFLSLGEVVEKQ